MFKYTLDNKRYHTLNYYYQKKYGCKVFKVSLNAHFSCPNIDGTKGYGGCIYCAHGSGEYYEDDTDLLTQFNEVKEMFIDNNIASKEAIEDFLEDVQKQPGKH